MEILLCLTRRIQKSRNDEPLAAFNPSTGREDINMKSVSLLVDTAGKGLSRRKGGGESYCVERE